MIFIFYDKIRHEKEDVELIYIFETDEEYLQYMRDNYFVTDEFVVSPSPITGIALEPYVDGLEAVDDGDSGGFDGTSTYAVIVNTNTEVKQEYFNAGATEYLQVAKKLERDRIIDNLTKN